MENRKSIWLKTDTKTLFEKLTKLKEMEENRFNAAILFAERNLNSKTISKLISNHQKKSNAINTIMAIIS
jgi:hypothetical protein